jgi:uncharacterized protein
MMSNKFGWRSALALLMGACLGLAALGAHAQAAGASCPPQPSPPTPQQMQEAMARAQDRGFLWRISKDGRTSHLFGTIHVGKLEWAVPGPKLRAALMEAETLALELDPLDPGVQAALAKPMPPLAMPPALAEQLARQLARACLPAQVVAAMHPMMQAMTVSVVEAGRDGLHVAFGQEFTLAGFARARQLPLVSLETAERQMAALIPTDAATARKLVASTLEQLDSGLARRVLARMADAWARGDLDELASYEKWCDCVNTPEDRAMVGAINDDRNPDMANKIAALHGGGKRVLAAVGALHMTGPKALPELLKARGFRVERVDFR